MMKTQRCNIFFVIGIFVLMIWSCTSKNLSESRETAQIFFDALKEGNTNLMLEKYEKVGILKSYFKSDSIQILNSSEIHDSLIKVTVKNFYTNGFGKLSNKEMALFISTDSTQSFDRIIDSRGLTDYAENEFYDFAKKVGCLKEVDTSDVEIGLKLLHAEVFAHELQMKTLLNFAENVSVLDWSWKSEYGGSASGKGIVQNNTNFNIPNVKYIVKYMDNKGNVLTTDDGYVSYNKLEFGESTAFTFYTSYIGNASKASITLDFDEEMIKKYVLDNKEYDGDEYDNFKNLTE